MTERRVTANDNRPERQPGEPNRRGSVAALAVVAIIAAVLFWTVSAIHQHNAVQDCIDSGRHDCVPVDTGSQ